MGTDTVSDLMIDEASQKLYIGAMLGNPALFARVQHLIKPTYFDANMQDAITFMKRFYQEHRGVPSQPVFQAGTKSDIQPIDLPQQDVGFVAEQLADFCQIRAVTEAVLAAPALIEKGDFGKMVADIKLASQVQLHSDLGIDYFADPHARLQESDSQEILIPLGWDNVDELIGGGVGRQELILLTANSGGGKSVGMLNIGFNLLKRGLNGVYITLEMRDRVVAKRLDSMISRISGKNISANKLKVGEDVEMAKSQGYGRFFVKRMREGSTNADHIISYLRELEAVHGFKPDFVIVDYLDLMASVMKHAGDNMFTKDKYVTEEVRAIGFDFDCLMISASQLGRCLDVNTIVMTKTGPVRLLDLQVGDQILSNTGYNEILIKTVPTRMECYRVTLEDGSSVVMSAYHMTPVFDESGSQIDLRSIKSGLKVGDMLRVI